MSKENILRITLFVSVLALNPVAANSLKLQINTQTQQSKTLSTSIANVLYKRGLDEASAEEISRNFLAEDEELFARMIENVLQQCSDISKEELLAYLGSEALFQNSLDLHSYDSLVQMYTKIKQQTPSTDIRTQLQNISQRNSQIVV